MKDGGPLVQCSYQRHYSWTKSSSSPVILTPTQRVYTDASAPQNPQTLPLYPDLSSLSTGAKEKTNLSLRDSGTTSPTSKENTERKLSYILRLVLTLAVTVRRRQMLSVICCLPSLHPACNANMCHAPMRRPLVFGELYIRVVPTFLQTDIRSCVFKTRH